MVHQIDFQLERDVPELSGKVLLVTGGTKGLGAGAVSLLAKRKPAKIYITGRNKAAAQKLINQAQEDGSQSEIIFLACDQTSLASVQQAADAFLAKESRLDVLMANAGIMAAPPGLTKDGYEMHFGVNHMAHALLIERLLPVLEETANSHGDARVIMMSSVGFVLAPFFQGIVFEDLKTEQDYMFLGPLQRYGQSKLANMLYGRELARRYPKVTTIVIHPGEVKTSLVLNLSGISKYVVYLGTYLKDLPFSLGQFLSVEQGPWNQVWAVGVPKDTVAAGEVYEPVGIAMTAYSSFRLNDKLAARLWSWTEGELKKWSDS
ncbi:unnamed protein product [Clonostachys byssicola]|uniref:Oxidoreductase n=1 Tax=Clonostachys byssicola TaxID=160290 RepID=A0A9N9UVM5_9HYPO|nr:unnamed protein product [Clonostachys byssicola]